MRAENQLFVIICYYLLFEYRAVSSQSKISLPRILLWLREVEGASEMKVLKGALYFFGSDFDSRALALPLSFDGVVVLTAWKGEVSRLEAWVRMRMRCSAR